MFQLFQQGVEALQDIAKSLHDGDITNTYLVVFTAILAIGTIIFGILDRKRTNKQIRTSEEKQERRFQEQSKKQDDEQFDRVRPWIIINEPIPKQVVFPDNSALNWDDFRDRDPSDRREPKTMKYTFKIVNTGIRPAKNLGRITYDGFSIITKDSFMKITESEMHMDLGPNQEQHITFILDWKNYLSLNEKPIFLGLCISYDNSRHKSYSGVIEKVTQHQKEIIATWYD